MVKKDRKEVIIVSACLAGVNCKYNGGNNLNNKIGELLYSAGAIPVCPEQLGGFTTPRLKTEIAGGTGAEVLDFKCQVKREDGQNVTTGFIKGAEEVLNIAKMTNAKKAILKSKSPSCGCGSIYDGTFSGKLIKGNGVTAELLLRNGIEVLNENDE